MVTDASTMVEDTPLRSLVDGLALTEYKRYLRSNAWAMRKNAYYKRLNRQCAACGSWKRIQLHHVSYDQLGHEPVQDLGPLCHKDHATPIRRINRSGLGIYELPPTRSWQSAGGDVLGVRACAN
jgi:hypothetical protein